MAGDIFGGYSVGWGMLLASAGGGLGCCITLHGTQDDSGPQRITGPEIAILL